LLQEKGLLDEASWVRRGEDEAGCGRAGFQDGFVEERRGGGENVMADLE
jgi:hypothetical protein